MHGKNRALNSNDREFAQIAELVRVYGFVHVVRIGGRVCAGVICWKVGAGYEVHPMAHDPRYDDYKLGMLTCYFTIRECIARGGSDFRFGWERSPFKYHFLGSGREYDRIRLYRSWLHFVLCGKLAAATAISGIASEARRWLQNAESRTGLLPRTAAGLVSLWRLRKKIGKRLSALIAVPVNQKAPAAPQGR